MNQFRPIEWFIISLVTLTAGALCLWRISDPDIFGYLFLGNQILNGTDITFDRWTYTINGTQWSPFHWFTYVLVALVHKLSGYEGLSILCGAMVATWIFIFSLIVGNNLPYGRTRRLTLIFLPFLALVMCCWRLRLKADLISLSLFALLVLIFTIKKSPSKLLRNVIALGVLLIWSNFHNGTYPLGALVFGLALMTEKWEGKNLLWFSLALIFWFTNPSGTRVVPAFLANSVNYGERIALFPNVDLLPISMRSFEFSYTLWSYYIWVPYTLFSFAVLGWCFFRNQKHQLPGPYQAPWFSLILSVIFVALTFKHARSIIYQVTFMLPIVCTGIRLLGEESRKLSALKQRGVYVMAIFAVLFTALKMVPDNFIYGRGPYYGVGLFRSILPYGALEFIKRHQPEPNILNPIDMGALIQLELPQYKVAIDWRDYPFIPFLRDLKVAQISQPKFEAFQKKYDINIIVDDRAMIPVYERFLDPNKWILVYRDQMHIIFIRNIPQHEKIIAAAEATIL